MAGMCANELCNNEKPRCPVVHSQSQPTPIIQRRLAGALPLVLLGLVLFLTSCVRVDNHDDADAGTVPPTFTVGDAATAGAPMTATTAAATMAVREGTPVVTATPVPTTDIDTSAPAPAPVGTVVYYEEEVTLLTYPYEEYQSERVDPRYNWPFSVFDMDRFRTEAPTPEPRTYRLIVLENTYLKLSVLPELGGRIWQVIHKPSGAPIFYQNDVVKPTHWGSVNQLGWLGLGGIEWGIPVIEHGYDWGVPWGFIPLQHSEDLASVTVFTPSDGRLLNASITISLRAGAAGFEIEPTITNLADRTLAFNFWHDAMLAPGTGKKPSPDLQFILPSDTMTVHSTNDATMPGPGQPFAWPIYQGRDLSRLGNYDQYLGFFEYPAAHGPFTAVYDPTYDVGLVRSYPADVAQGSKVFVLGWQDALTSDNFTDDDSFYVELHGGLAPTFGDQYRLPARGQVSWREQWYPVAAIGTVSFANEFAALRAEVNNNQLEIAIYPTRPIAGKIVLLAGAAMDRDGEEQNGRGSTVAEEQISLGTIDFTARPDAPFQAILPMPTDYDGAVTIQLEDNGGFPLLSYPLP